MKRFSFLIVIASLSACTEPTPPDQVSEAVLQASCEALVSSETGVGPNAVSATSTKTDPTGSVTTVTVAGAQAPWLCLADPFGVIIGVEYSQAG